MKKCIFGLCILGLTNLIYAQNELAMTTTHLSENSSTTSKVTNEKYLNFGHATNQQLAASIKKLQKVAADYDITKERVYSNNKSITYDVVIEANGNYIKAVYDYKGIIISSEEYYEDIKVPFDLGCRLAKEYPGWSFDKNNCRISYSEQGEATFTYNLKLKRGNTSKSITRTL